MADDRWSIVVDRPEQTIHSRQSTGDNQRGTTSRRAPATHSRPTTLGGAPGRDPGSAAHAEAAVDRDDRSGDVTGGFAGQPGHHAGDLVRGREPAERNHLAVLRG